MKRQKHTVKLTTGEREELEKLIKSKAKRATNQCKRRAKVLLLLDENGDSPRQPKEVAKECKIHRETIYDIRKLFVENGLNNVTSRKKRETPPVEPKITGEVQAHIIATACSEAPEGKAKWTLQMIADKVVLDGVIDGISGQSVMRVLKKANLPLT